MKAVSVWIYLTLISQTAVEEVLTPHQSLSRHQTALGGQRRRAERSTEAEEESIRRLRRRHGYLNVRKTRRRSVPDGRTRS